MNETVPQLEGLFGILLNNKRLVEMPVLAKSSKTGGPRWMNSKKD